jgi:hypothetical protein
MASPCPHDGSTQRYTDPLLQVRCKVCFDVRNDEAAGTPMGRVQDLSAPMVIGSHVYHGAFTRYDRW